MRERPSLPTRLSLLALLAGLAGLLAIPSPEPGTPPAPRPAGGSIHARVVRAVDGDTIEVRARGREETVRYIGLDTPESVQPGTPVQCFGHEASAANARLVEGRRVRLSFGA